MTFKIFVKHHGNIISLFLLLSICCRMQGQPVEFNGQAAGWITSNYNNGFAFQSGVRYIPQLLLKVPLNEKLTLDGELSADTYLSYSFLPDTTNDFESRLALYRFWLRLSGDRFEIRAGLQKVNFGSASMLRPLMWFDRIDPRDPLRLTKGVYALQGKYFFKNNASVWLWVLYGNRDTKGWEIFPSNAERPECGGRLQLPVPKGEIAFTYHNRSAEFPQNWQPPVTGSRTLPENRFGLDFKLDLGVGLWFEGTVIHQRQQEIAPFTRSATLGADYTAGIGNGLNITAEHLFFTTAEELFMKGDNLSFTGLSASIPLSIITRVSTIVFYDWKNMGLYRFVNVSLTFDKFAFNFIGFWNPETFGLFNYGTGPNMFQGAGGQVMIVYNH